MPPKKKQNTADDKKKIKEMQKIAEDKSFGMKNKNKSKTVQKMIKGMATATIKGGMDGIIGAKFEEKKAKEAAEKERKFLESIKQGDHRAANNEQMQEEIKTKVCPYFKAGQCQKGKKCKFSHDRGSDNTNIKANIYQDIRNEGNEDDQLYSDQKKLEEAVTFNQKKYNNPNATNLPCNHFLNAIAEKKYGWFWVCPNGTDCKYKHALPPGFVLQTKKKGEEETVEFEVERDIDEAREKLMGQKGTPVTYERYMEWRERRKKRKAKEAEEKRQAELKKVGIKIPKAKKIMSGKALFVFDPSLFQDADDAADNKDLKAEDIEEDKELNAGGKKWEAKKDDIIEEVREDNENHDIDSIINGEKIQVDEDAFADEEELPDDID